MTEIELKFQVPQERRAALAKAVGTATARNVRLQAHYFDTDDRRLAQALLALRVRKEGRRWVQTLKGAGDGLWQRLEHEVPVTVAPGQLPVADLGLHDGTPAGEALRKALGDASLVPTYGTDVRRCLRLLRAPGCTVELAFDQGALQAGDQRWPLCELEFELKAGDAIAMTQVAARWVGRFGLTLDTRSKSERGDRLARGVRLGAPVKAQPVQLAAEVDSPSAVRSIIGSCLAHVLGNASDIAHGESSPEHLHQLRVGLRRLRTALRELADLLPGAKPQWNEALTQVFGRLGAARDIDALAQTLLPALRKAGASALTAAGRRQCRAARGGVARARHAGPVARTAGLCRGQCWPRPPIRAVRARLQERLARLHRQVRRDAKLFASIDDTARHRLRKRIKRLRYLCDFAASLHDRKAVKAFVAPLAVAQEALGAFNDVCVARTLFDRDRGGRLPGDVCTGLAGPRARRRHRALRVRAEEAAQGTGVLVAASEVSRPCPSPVQGWARWLGADDGSRSPSGGSATAAARSRWPAPARCRGACSARCSCCSASSPEVSIEIRRCISSTTARVCRRAAAPAALSILPTAPKNSEPNSSNTCTPGGSVVGARAARTLNSVLMR